jgi:DNA modification methylase
MGTGTTAVVSKKLKRNYIGSEISEEYIKVAKKRLKELDGLLNF